MSREDVPVEGRDSPDYVQIALAALVVLILIVAASVAPGIGPTAGPGGGDGELDALLPTLEDPTTDPGQPNGDDPNGDDPNGDDNGDPDENGDGEEEESPNGEPDQLQDSDSAVIDSGAFSEPSDTPHFEVHSPEPAYWRATAYDQYDGTGWQRSAELERDQHIYGEAHRDRLSHGVVPLIDSNFVPSAYQPVDFDRSPAGGELGPMDGIQLDETVEAEEVGIGIHSLRPFDDSERLRSAGMTYPDHITDTYTDVPEEVPERVASFTEDLTNDANSPYETAAVIAYWMRTNYDYELDVPPPEGEITDELLFERDEAYCAYFASSMTVMLRTQGIPARYVTGYNTGEPDLNEDIYTVRGMHAHAWVEVFFPEYGWVPFEPTPADDRQTAIDEEVEEGEAAPSELSHMPDEELEAELEAMPGVNPGDFADRPATDPDERYEEEEDEEPDPPDPTPEFTVSVLGDVVPGNDVTVYVQEDGEPVEGAAVYVEGEYIGETDAHGEVGAVIPFAPEIEIRAVRDGDVGTAGGSQLGSLVFASGDTAVLATETNTTVPIEGEFNLSIDGIPFPGNSLDGTVTFADRPIEDTDLYLDDNHVGVTDADGEVTIPLPDEPGNVSLRAERGEFVTEHELDIAPVTFTPEVRPIPGRTIPMNVSAGAHPLPNATINVDHTPVAETNASGVGSITLPEAESIHIAASFSGTVSTDELTLTPLLVHEDARPMPEKSINVSVTAADEPVDDATLHIGDDVAGTTNTDGIGEVVLPDQTGEVPLDVTYDGATNATALDVYPLEVEISDMFALPFRTATANVTWAGEPVPNTSVAFAGRMVGETGSDGTISDRLPLTNEVTVTAIRNGARGSASIDGMLLHAAGILAGFGAVLAVGGFLARDRIVRGFRIVRKRVQPYLERAIALLGRLLDAAVDIGRWLDRMRRRGWKGLHALVLRLYNQRVRVYALPAYLSAKLAVLHPDQLSGQVERFIAWIKGLFSRSKSSAAAGAGGVAGRTPSGTSADIQSLLSMRELWARFVVLVRPPRLRTRTPGEIKRYAIDRGFPRSPVERIVDAFRLAEYRNDPPTAEELDEVERVIEQDLEAHGEGAD